MTYLKYLKRAASNPSITFSSSYCNKLYYISDLARAYSEMSRCDEAIVLFKQIIRDSRVQHVPADQCHVYLAETYITTKKFDDAAELLLPLYCKRVFEVEPRQMGLFLSLYDNIPCFREAIFRFMSTVSHHLFKEGEAYDRTGYDFLCAKQMQGT